MSVPVRRNGPKAVSCYICGRQYMCHSFEIHEKQCRELFEKKEMLKLPRERKKCPANPMNGVKLTGSESDIAAYNAAAAETWSTSLSGCQFCGRRFLPEKLAIHNKSCRADNPARRISDSVNRSPAAIEAQSEVKANDYDSRRTGSFNSESQGGGNLPSEFSSSGEDSTKCTLCGRTFNCAAFEKHSKICKKVFCAKRKVFDSAKARASGTELAAYNKQNAKNAGKSGARRPASDSRSPVGGGGGNSDLQAAYNLRDNKSSAPQANQMPKWKRDSLNFRQAMKDARAYDAETKASTPAAAAPSRGATRTSLQGPVSSGTSRVSPRAGITSGAGAKSRVTSSTVGKVTKVGAGIPSTGPSSTRPNQAAPRPTQTASVQREQQMAEIDPSFLKCPHCSRSFNEKAAERHIPLCKNTFAKPSRLTRGSGVPSYSTNRAF